MCTQKTQAPVSPTMQRAAGRKALHRPIHPRNRGKNVHLSMHFAELCIIFVSPAECWVNINCFQKIPKIEVFGANPDTVWSLYSTCFQNARVKTTGQIIFISGRNIAVFCPIWYIAFLLSVFSFPAFSIDGRAELY